MLIVNSVEIIRCLPVGPYEYLQSFDQLSNASHKGFSSMHAIVENNSFVIENVEW